MVENNSNNVMSDKKTEVPSTRIIPLFSKRSIIVLSIGLVIGIGIALFYWIISPNLTALSSSGTQQAGSVEGGLAEMLGIAPSGPYSSRVNVQIVNPGSEYKTLGTLQQIGEYYAAKANSLPFLQFLAQELSQAPFDHEFTVDELYNNISFEYDYSSALPAIKINVIANTEDEAIMLAEILPQTFRDYLVAEEKEQRQKQYENTLIEIGSVKDALYQAQQELNDINSNKILDQNPEYISLQAKVDALQQLLDLQASKLVENVDEKDVQNEYYSLEARLDVITDQLAREQENLKNISLQMNNLPVDEASYLTLEAKVNALQNQLDFLMTGDALTVGMADLIANGDTASETYKTLKTKIDTASAELAVAKKELQEINSETATSQSETKPEYQISQIKINTLKAQQEAILERLSQVYQQMLDIEGSTNQKNVEELFNDTSLALTQAKEELENLKAELGYDVLSSDLDIKIAQDKVNMLNDRLETLTQQLSSLVGDSGDTLSTEYLVAGNPSLPSPVLPERARARNTLMMGAIVGIIVAWMVLNYKWIIRQITLLGKGEEEENDSE